MDEYREAEARYLATRADRDYMRLYYVARKMARRYAKRIRTSETSADEAAEKVMMRYKAENGFSVRNAESYYFRAVYYNRDGRHGTKPEGAELIEAPDERESADGIARRDDPKHYIDELLEAEAGRWLVVRLWQARSLRRACLDAEASGISRAWIRDHARQIVGVWRVLHGGKRGGGRPESDDS